MVFNCKECIYYIKGGNIVLGCCSNPDFNQYQYIEQRCPGWSDKVQNVGEIEEFVKDLDSTISPVTPKKTYKIGEKVAILKNGLKGIIENVRDGLYWTEYKLHNIEEWYNSNELTPVLCEKSMWIARDEDDSLWVFSDEPTLDGNTWTLKYDGKNTMNQLTSTLFPEVTFENSPKKVEIKIW